MFLQMMFQKQQRWRIIKQKKQEAKFKSDMLCIPNNPLVYNNYVRIHHINTT